MYLLEYYLHPLIIRLNVFDLEIGANCQISHTNGASASSNSSSFLYAS